MLSIFQFQKSWVLDLIVFSLIMSISDHRLTPAVAIMPPFPDSSVFMSNMTMTTNEQHQQQYRTTIDPHQPPPFKKPRNFEDNQSKSSNVYHQHQQQQQPIVVQPPNLLINNRGVNNIFFKTRLCAKFRVGQCRNGENCNFAHGAEDMRQPPVNWQELVHGGKEDDNNNNTKNNNNPSAGNWDDDQRIIHKMKLCKKFYNGEQCPYGERCNFFHEDPKKFRDDSGRFRESSAISVVGVSEHQNLPDQYDNKATNQNLMDPYRTNMKTVYWKTKICSRFEATGQCSFAEKCHFAHGLAELQQHGGRIVGEMITTTGITSTKPIIPGALNDQPSSNTTSGEVAPMQDEGSDHRKRLLKWKGLQKINRIYADWIDDLPLLAHGLASSLES